MTKVHAFLTKSLSGQRHEFFHICLARSQERGHDLPTLSGELIAVAAVDFFDDSVRPQTCQRPRDSSTLPMGFSRIGLARIKGRSHVPVAEAAHRPRAASGSDQGLRARWRRPSFTTGRHTVRATSPALCPACTLANASK